MKYYFAVSEKEVEKYLTKNGTEGMMDFSDVFTGMALSLWEDAYESLINEDLKSAEDDFMDLQFHAVNSGSDEAMNVARGAANWFEKLLEGGY